MIIKKYLAKSEQEAIEMAREDLGSNAVVMNIKKVRPKGMAKIFMRGKVEVTAALEDSEAGHIDVEIPKETPTEIAAQPKHQESLKEDEQNIQDKLMTLQLLLEKQMKESGQENKNPTKQNVSSEVQETEEQDKEREEQRAEDKTAAYQKLVYKQLVQNEVDSEIAESIIQEISRSLPSDAAVDQILASVYQKIILMMGQPYLIEPEQKKGRNMSFFLVQQELERQRQLQRLPQS